MSPSPYRSINVSETREPRARERRCDSDLWPAFTLFWMISAARVVEGVLRHEVFGAEATLALMSVVGLPWLFFRRSR
jgi:hypothetical protein